MTRVFISYSRNDRRRNRRAVAELARALDAAGIEVWRDVELYGGQSWWDEILRQLRSAEAVVAVISPTSAESPACRSEVAYANAVHRTVIPVQVDDLGPEDATGTLPTVQWIDYRKRSQEALLSLVKAVNRADPRPPPDPLPDPPAAPPPRPQPRWWKRPKIQLLIACAVLVVIALGAVVLWPDPDSTTEVSVPANRAWTATGVDVDVGDELEVTSTGQIVHDTGDPHDVGPDGDDRPELRVYNVLADVNHAALIGRIGDEDAQPFLVGASRQFTADRSGPLYLGINDAGVENNTGSFTSVLTIETPD
jgi:hypothetical protein